MRTSVISVTPDMITAPDILDVLAKVEIFRSLRREDLQEMARIAEKRTYKNGDTVVSMGDPGEEMFIVQAGAFEVFQLNQKLGLKRTLARLVPGQYFGEISLLSGAKRSASVLAEGDSEVLVLKKSDLMSLLDRCPAVAQGLLQGMARYVHSHSQAGAAISFASLDQFPHVQETFTILPVRISLYCEALVVAKHEKALTV